MPSMLEFQKNQPYFEGIPTTRISVNPLRSLTRMLKFSLVMSVALLLAYSCKNAEQKLRQGAVVTKWQMTGSWSDGGNAAGNQSTTTSFIDFQGEGKFHSNINAYSRYDHFELVGDNQIRFYTAGKEMEKVNYSISSGGLEIFRQECDDCGQEFVQAAKEEATAPERYEEDQ